MSCTKKSLSRFNRWAMNRAEYKERGIFCKDHWYIFLFRLSAASSHPCSSFIYRNWPRVKPVLRLGDGERIKCLIARVLATVSEQNGSYVSRFINIFLLRSLLLFSLWNKYLAFAISAWNLPFNSCNIWFFNYII